MNENIDLTKILANAPKGTKLWSPLCGECEFGGILSSNNLFKVRVKYKEEEGNTTQYLCFSPQGKYCDCSEAECLLFPSKNQRDWSKFGKYKKPLMPFQKVLVRTASEYPWRCDFYSHYDASVNVHYCISGFTYKDKNILPYEGNEYRLGTVTE